MGSCTNNSNPNRSRRKFVVGIDEVGRGALAGPVMVVAVAMPARCQVSRVKYQERCRTRNLVLKDSKKLTPKQREAWFSYFKSHPQIEYAVARVYPRAIERMNISAAANVAALRAFGRLTVKCQLSNVNCSVFLDGGLFLGNHRSGLTRKSGAVEAEKRGSRNIRAYPLLKNKKHPRISASTVVRGDEKIKVVSMASIVAKVSRDRAMVRLAKQYPQYGFEVHKGYGTRAHLAAIKKYGICGVHRKTFDPIARMS
ncbi:MAG: hypothetical protein A2945_01050 [Candidatus Liptonbacteria bacterium RIFCSPLOWO2_01_FULL_52_25]|uniref:Ribonuclease n=1 Tax=Candidatus Liptonbacteria bacterium RIFCSPLOWO2_01_FULL_52_25 TaxID=1798650 RepID=A0A1G2CG85_9BACT|nr:MAG: hypothetical protein A2945_01050 [Candidatus Liptonbacteria bacterium RIFCSPLOWO2_01_FULL_52_25]